MLRKLLLELSVLSSLLLLSACSTEPTVTPGSLSVLSPEIGAVSISPSSLQPTLTPGEITPSPRLTAIASPTSRPTITPPAFPYEIGPETIVFVSRRLDLWLIESDGTNPRALTQDRWEDTLPRWSPDGSLIAFLSNRDYNEHYDIWVIEPVNGTCQRVTSNGAKHFSWSPDGMHLAYSNDEGVWVIGLGDATPELLSQAVRNPEWSPDGTVLAVMGPSMEAGSSTFTVPSLITLGDDSTLTVLDFLPGNFAPDSMTWSSDSRTLVLVRFAGHGWGGFVDLTRVVNGAPSHIHSIGKSSFPELSHLSAFTPRLSPDGERIVFAVARSGTLDYQGGMIYYATADLENVTAITSEEAFASHPDWSGDGSRLVFTIGEGRSMGLYVFDTRSDELRQLPTPSGVHGQPDWHP